MGLARHAFDMMELLLVMWCRLSCPTFAREDFLYIREFNMKEDCLCKMLGVYMCVHRYLYFGICCRQEVGWISSHAVKTLTAPIGFLLEMSFKVSIDIYLRIYM